MSLRGRLLILLIAAGAGASFSGVSEAHKLSRVQATAAAQRISKDLARGDVDYIARTVGGEWEWFGSGHVESCRVSSGRRHRHSAACHIVTVLGNGEVGGRCDRVIGLKFRSNRSRALTWWVRSSGGDCAE